jgi:hypothetical protein
MHILYTLLLGTLLAVLLSSPLLGLAVAVITVLQLVQLAWQHRHDPHDPTLY